MKNEFENKGLKENKDSKMNMKPDPKQPGQQQPGKFDPNKQQQPPLKKDWREGGAGNSGQR